MFITTQRKYFTSTESAELHQERALRIHRTTGSFSNVFLLLSVHFQMQGKGF